MREREIKRDSHSHSLTSRGRGTEPSLAGFFDSLDGGDIKALIEETFPVPSVRGKERKPARETEIGKECTKEDENLDRNLDFDRSRHRFPSSLLFFPLVDIFLVFPLILHPSRPESFVQCFPCPESFVQSYSHPESSVISSCS